MLNCSRDYFLVNRNSTEYLSHFFSYTYLDKMIQFLQQQKKNKTKIRPKKEIKKNQVQNTLFKNLSTEMTNESIAFSKLLHVWHKLHSTHSWHVNHI